MYYLKDPKLWELWLIPYNWFPAGEMLKRIMFNPYQVYYNKNVK